MCPRPTAIAKGLPVSRHELLNRIADSMAALAREHGFGCVVIAFNEHGSAATRLAGDTGDCLLHMRLALEAQREELTDELESGSTLLS